jgi:hypothetical protein
MGWPVSAPYALLRLPDGLESEVHAGTVIGRLASSPLPIDHPGVSEAHALLSYRGDGLQLISLTGQRLQVEGRRAAFSVRLEAGLRIDLVDGLSVEVAEVHLPDHVLALELGDGAEWTRLGQLAGAEHYSVLVDPRPRLVAGEHPKALGRVASNAEGFVLHTPAGADVLRPGLEWDLAGWRLRGVAVQLSTVPRTRLGPDPGQPCALVLVGTDEVRVVPAAAPPFVLKDTSGAIVARLIDAERPVGRQSLADSLCGGSLGAFQTALSRLKETLRRAGVDPSFLLDCDRDGRPTTVRARMWVSPPHRRRAGPLHRYVQCGGGGLRWAGEPVLGVSLTVDEFEIAQLVALTPQGRILLLVEGAPTPTLLLRLAQLASALMDDPRSSLAAVWDADLAGAMPSEVLPIELEGTPILGLVITELPDEVRQLAAWLATPERPVHLVEARGEDELVLHPVHTWPEAGRTTPRSP